LTDLQSLDHRGVVVNDMYLQSCKVMFSTGCAMH